MRCLRVRVEPDTVWSLFYGSIDGFDYEEGFTWRIEAERRPIVNPPADGSSVAFRLLEILAKVPE